MKRFSLASALTVPLAGGLAGCASPSTMLTSAPTVYCGMNGISDPWMVLGATAMAKAPWLTVVADPVYGTRIERIAGDPGTPVDPMGSPAYGNWSNDARHHYSKDQPWSSDGKLLSIQNVGQTQSKLFLDGDTYQVKYGKCRSLKAGDDRWHPDPRYATIRIGADETSLLWYDVTTCTVLRSWTLPISVDLFGSGEGNPSFDGRYAALGDATRAFVVDMDPQPPYAPYPNVRMGPVRSLTDCALPGGCTATWVSISPSGRYAVVHYSGEALRVYDVDPSTLALTPRRMPPVAVNCLGDGALGFVYNLGHADMTLNPFDGDQDVLVGQEHCGNRGQTVDGKLIGGVVMVRLRDGEVTPLTKPPNEAYPQHISTRAYDNRGWAYVGYYPQAGKRFDDEIVAVSLDGTGAVLRYTRKRGQTSGCYRCEAHAVPSRDGRRVMFASNWMLDCGSGCGSPTVIQAFVVDARPCS